MSATPPRPLDGLTILVVDDHRNTVEPVYAATGERHDGGLIRRPALPVTFSSR
jgi:hypothetical protein